MIVDKGIFMVIWSPPVCHTILQADTQRVPLASCTIDVALKWSTRTFVWVGEQISFRARERARDIFSVGIVILGAKKATNDLSSVTPVQIQAKCSVPTIGVRCNALVGSIFLPLSHEDESLHGDDWGMKM